MTIQELIANVRAGVPHVFSLPSDQVDSTTITWLPEQGLFEIYDCASQIYNVNPMDSRLLWTEERLVKYLEENMDLLER